VRRRQQAERALQAIDEIAFPLDPQWIEPLDALFAQLDRIRASLAAEDAPPSRAGTKRTGLSARQRQQREEAVQTDPEVAWEQLPAYASGDELRRQVQCTVPPASQPASRQPASQPQRSQRHCAQVQAVRGAAAAARPWVATGDHHARSQRHDPSPSAVRVVRTGEAQTDPEPDAAPEPLPAPWAAPRQPATPLDRSLAPPARSAVPAEVWTLASSSRTPLRAEHLASPLARSAGARTWPDAPQATQGLSAGSPGGAGVGASAARDRMQFLRSDIGRLDDDIRRLQSRLDERIRAREGGAASPAGAAGGRLDRSQAASLREFHAGSRPFSHAQLTPPMTSACAALGLSPDDVR
jgi:hypothetical protein